MTKLEAFIIKTENKMAYKAVGRGLDAVVESDFNPDFIIMMGDDCYATGLHTGIAATAIGIAVIGAGYSVLKRVIKKHRGKEES